jgi:hypothetical protein
MDDVWIALTEQSKDSLQTLLMDLASNLVVVVGLLESPSIREMSTVLIA